MNFLQLECFISIVKNNSYTKASQEMSISVSSLSKYIKSMEEELHVQLLSRDKHNVHLTSAGEEVLLMAEKVLSEYRSTQLRLKKYAFTDVIRLGAIEHIGKLGLTTPISQFMSSHPNIQIDLNLGDTHSLMENLDAGHCDLAIVAYSRSIDGTLSNLDEFHTERYFFYTLLEDSYQLVLHKHHPLASRKTVSWNDIRDEKFLLLGKRYHVSKLIRNAFALHNIQPDIVLECEQTDPILGLIDAGFGVSLLSSGVVSSRQHILTIPMDRPISRNTVLVVPKDNRSRSIQTFVDTLAEYYRKRSVQNILPDSL